MNIKAHCLSFRFAYLPICCFIMTCSMNALSGVKGVKVVNAPKVSKLKLPAHISAKIEDLPVDRITIPALKMFDNSFAIRGIRVYATSKTPMYYLANLLKALTQLDDNNEKTPSNAKVVIFDFDEKEGKLVPRVFADNESKVYRLLRLNESGMENTVVIYAGIATKNRADNLTNERYQQLQDELPSRPNVFSKWLNPPPVLTRVVRTDSVGVPYFDILSTMRTDSVGVPYFDILSTMVTPHDHALLQRVSCNKAYNSPQGASCALE